jgi:hypothetical protein
MSKRIILIILIIILAAIIGLGGYYLYARYYLQSQINNLNYPTNAGLVNNNLNQAINNQNINSANPLAANVSSDEKSQLEPLALIFAQNFGSYSNQTALTNFDEIYDFMSASMKNWIEKTFKPSVYKDHPQAVYYAIETKALNVTITKNDENKGTASVLINTQRQEFKDNPDNVNVFNQNLLLNFVQVNDKWIVDSAYWQ